MIALFVLMGLVGLSITGLMAVPVELQARAALGGKLEAALRVSWLFGRVEREISPSAARSQQARSLPRREQLELLTRKPFRDRVIQLFERCKPAVRVGLLSGRARIGLGDPAETGYALGALLPILDVLSQHPNIDLQLDPDWSQPILEGRVQGQARVIPLRLAPPLFAFALSREVIETVRAWRRAKS